MANIKNLHKRPPVGEVELMDETQIEQLMAGQARATANEDGSLPEFKFPAGFRDEDDEKGLTPDLEDTLPPEPEPTPEPEHEPITQVPAFPSVSAEEAAAAKVEVPEEKEEAPAPARAPRRRPGPQPRATAAPKEEKPVVEKTKVDVGDLILFDIVAEKLITEAKKTTQLPGIESDLYWDKILEIIKSN